ncbi:MAG TPA: T9SS type A sorting domain-containing protein [Bacteroidales bacterium]|nr:T9SS type A sorting domain-containing protein [Bacteroidales bacterium]HSA43128.1 T9SS type A sorting domain-containing protein [Bacteroidales bacterium]
MKKSFLFTVLLLLAGAPSLVFTQPIPSSCNVPWILQQEYELDVKGLAVKWMMQSGSPDTVYVSIPSWQQDEIMEGLAAVFNVNHPARDSVFDQYCVHDMAWQPVTHGLIIGVGATAPWIPAWQSLQTMTGLPALDTLLTKYQLQITNWFSFINAAVFQTPLLLNIYALEDSLKWASPHIQYAEPDLLIGAAGLITYDKTGNDRYYNFTFQWNDCFDGCDNWHTWMFRVTHDCAVEYLGFTEGGVFGIEPLPAPINCNITTGLRLLPAVKLAVYPNPASDILCIDWQEKFIEELTVVDPGGKTVCTIRNIMPGLIRIPVGQLPEGIYFLRIQSGNSMFTEKFIR